MIDISAVFSNYLGSGPLSYTGKNSSGAGATDGTEFLAQMVDNWMWGWTQALLSQEGFSPDGSTEAVGASQIVDAIGNMYPPGLVTEWNINTDPATYGARFLLLNGQGILRSNYTKLDENVWCGAGLNATAGAYYRADDAAGTVRNVSGAYLILPESRGYTTRGLDLAASVDPDGASRTLGDNQLDAFQGWQAVASSDFIPGYIGGSNSMASGGANVLRSDAGSQSGNGVYPGDDGINGTPRISSESRMTNRSTQFAIKY